MTTTQDWLIDSVMTYKGFRDFYIDLLAEIDAVWWEIEDALEEGEWGDFGILTEEDARRTVPFYKEIEYDAGKYPELADVLGEGGEELVRLYTRLEERDDWNCILPQSQFGDYIKENFQALYGPTLDELASAGIVVDWKATVEGEEGCWAEESVRIGSETFTVRYQ